MVVPEVVLVMAGSGGGFGMVVVLWWWSSSALSTVWSPQAMEHMIPYRAPKATVMFINLVVSL